MRTQTPRASGGRTENKFNKDQGSNPHELPGPLRVSCWNLPRIIPQSSLLSCSQEDLRYKEHGGPQGAEPIPLIPRPAPSPIHTGHLFQWFYYYKHTMAVTLKKYGLYILFYLDRAT